MAFIMGQGEAVLAGFRRELHGCFGARADALFEACDAVLCAAGRVSDLARLSLVPEFRRGHGALYDALNCGRAEIGRLRTAVAGLPLPAWPDRGIRLAVDVSAWLRPEAASARTGCSATSPAGAGTPGSGSRAGRTPWCRRSGPVRRRGRSCSTR